MRCHCIFQKAKTLLFAMNSVGKYMTGHTYLFSVYILLLIIFAVEITLAVGTAENIQEYMETNYTLSSKTVVPDKVGQELYTDEHLQIPHLRPPCFNVFLTTLNR